MTSPRHPAHQPVVVPPTAGSTWDECVAVIGDLALLTNCAQEPAFHAEGNVAVHTQMVLEALLSDPAYHQLTPDEQNETYLAALLHDIAKPACTKVEDGRITAKGHARLGALHARRILWHLGIPPATRERICTLIHYHLHPFWALERSDADRHARAVSLRASCNQLAVLATADGCGRITESPNELGEAVAMYSEWCHEIGTGTGPFPFGNPTARVEYFRRENRDPYWTPPESNDFTVTVMSGLPGSGKDTWVAANRPDTPTVSLDQIRHDHGIDPKGPQGAAISLAREAARTLLRTQTDFTWNATNIAADHRGQVIDLCINYGARVHIVAVETTHPEIAIRNKTRTDPVPPDAIEKMIRRWDAPNLCEAHDLTFVTTT